MPKQDADVVDFAACVATVRDAPRAAFAVAYTKAVLARPGPGVVPDIE